MYIYVYWGLSSETRLNDRVFFVIWSESVIKRLWPPFAFDLNSFKMSPGGKSFEPFLTSYFRPSEDVEYLMTSSSCCRRTEVLQPHSVHNGQLRPRSLDHSRFDCATDWREHSPEIVQQFKMTLNRAFLQYWKKNFIWFIKLALLPVVPR